VALIPSDIQSSKTALVIFQPTKCGWRPSPLSEPCGDESPHSTNSSIGLNDGQGQQDKD